MKHLSNGYSQSGRCLQWFSSCEIEICDLNYYQQLIQFKIFVNCIINLLHSAPEEMQHMKHLLTINFQSGGSFH